jgi:hypothetical protein
MEEGGGQWDERETAQILRQHQFEVAFDDADEQRYFTAPYDSS